MSHEYLRNYYNKFRAELHKQVAVPAEVNTIPALAAFADLHPCITFYKRKIGRWEEWYNISMKKTDECWVIFNEQLLELIPNKNAIIIDVSPNEAFDVSICTVFGAVHDKVRHVPCFIIFVQKEVGYPKICEFL